MKKMMLVFLLFLVFVSSLFSQGNREDKTISVISREEGSGTRSAFVSLLGIETSGEDLTTLTSEIANSTSVVITTVENNKNAIGYISLGSLSDRVKALEIDSVLPTIESVKSGEYKVARPFIVATKNPSSLTLDFLSFVMSEDGQSLIEKKGYIKSSDSSTSYNSSYLKGELMIAGSSSVYPVMEVLVEAYMALNKDVKITLLQSDSTTGLNDLDGNKVDIALSSRELKEAEINKGLVPTVIAQDGIAVIVNKDNEVSSLSSTTVRDIYLGLITSWDNQ